MSTLKAIPNNWFSWNFIILDHHTPIANIDLAWVRESGEFNLGGYSYKVYRDGLFSGTFILEKHGLIVAQAEKTSALIRSFQIDYEDKSYILEAESPLRRKFILREGSHQVGALEPEHPFSRKITIDLPDEITLSVRIFMVWLMIIIWKREASQG